MLSTSRLLSQHFSALSSPLLHMGGHGHLHDHDHEHKPAKKADNAGFERDRRYFIPSDMETVKFKRLEIDEAEFKRRTENTPKEIEAIYSKLARRWGEGFITKHPIKHESFEKLMKIMFTPEDAKFVSRIPTIPISITALRKKFNYGLDKKDGQLWEKGFTEVEINKKIDDLAGKGLLYDFYVTKKGPFGYEKRERYVAFPDYILGWYEFYWMRIQQTGELPPKRVADLLEVFQTQSGYYDELYRGETPYFRFLIREDSIKKEEAVQIMDYESVSKFVENAHTLAISGCGCRLHMKSCGHDIDPYPTNCCFSFNSCAENLLRNGMAKTISRSEARDVIENCKSLGMCETGDNIKMPNFLCHCEKKYCSVLGAMNRHHKKSFIPSNYHALVSNVTNCTSCGKCVKNCPVDAIKLKAVDVQQAKIEDIAQEEGKKVSEEVKTALKKKAKSSKKMVPSINLNKCLGCGVCVTVCEPSQQALKIGKSEDQVIRMIRREKEAQVVVPENFLERTIRMAIERRRLHKLIFSDPEFMSHRVLGKVAQILEESDTTQALLAIKPLDSIFLNTVCKVAAITHGKIFEKI